MADFARIRHVLMVSLSTAALAACSGGGEATLTPKGDAMPPPETLTSKELTAEDVLAGPPEPVTDLEVTGIPEDEMPEDMILENVPIDELPPLEEDDEPFPAEEMEAAEKSAIENGTPKNIEPPAADEPPLSVSPEDMPEDMMIEEVPEEMAAPEPEPAQIEPAPEPEPSPAVVPALPPVRQTPATLPDKQASLDQRVTALEQDVQSLRNDFQEMIPAFKGLVTANERITQLLAKMEGKMQTAGRLAPGSTEPAAGVDVPTVNDVRIGEHPGKTRVVLDITDAVAFQTDLDNEEKILLVKLPSTYWEADTSKVPSKSPLVAAWTADAGASSVTMAIQLKQAAKILSTEMLKPENGEPARLVIDIAPAS